MKIAEFFVGLGIKGDGSAKKGLQGVEKGLGNVKSMSLEAKAAIIAAIYALERMMSASAKEGTGLMNFSAMTGLSAQKLQEWQYAARQVGVANEELTGSVKSVQNAMTNMLMGKGAPEGLAMLANKVGFDINQARDTFYVMQKLQEFANSGVPKDVSSAIIKSFGLSEGVIAGMQRNAFRDDIFKNAPKYSEGQQKNLDRVNAAWANLGTKVDMAFGKFTSKHGLQLVEDISKITTQVFRMVDAFTQLAEKLKLFQVVGKVFEGWGLIFGAIESGVQSLTETEEDKPWKGLEKNPVDMLNDWIDSKMDRAFNGSNIAPTVKPGANQPKQINQNFNNNFNFQHDGKDHKKTGDSVQKAIKSSYYQSGVLSQEA